MTILSTDHVNIIVSDMDNSVKFYIDILGLEKSMDKILEGEWIEKITGFENFKARCVYLEAPTGSRVELLQYISPAPEHFDGHSSPRSIGLRHLAFEVDDIQCEYQRLSDYGIKFLSPPQTVPFKPGKGGKQKKLCYFRDPDGTILELAEFKVVD